MMHYIIERIRSRLRRRPRGRGPCPPPSRSPLLPRTRPALLDVYITRSGHKVIRGRK